MYFSDYKKHRDVELRQSLLWEYDLEKFDWQAMRNLVVQRVIERGRPDDYYAILNKYGLNGVKDAIVQIPYLNPRDISFVCLVFDLNINDLQCFIRKQSKIQHWIS
jgi:hypothetical protein